MSRCAVKRGFVALRDCGNEATGTCADCARPICVEHTRTESAAILCVECFAGRARKQAEEQARGANRGTFSLGDGTKAKGVVSRPQNPQNDDWADTSWAYNYRTYYYNHYSYSPLFWGHYNSYYDSYDVRSFDESTEGSTSDDESAAGFYDS